MNQLQVSDDGTKIIKAGRMIDEGTWEHQVNSKKYTLEEIKHSHPDFIWLPTNAYQDQNGYGNPFLVPAIAKMITGGGPAPTPTGNLGKHLIVKVSFRTRDFKTTVLTEESVKRAVMGVLLRDGLKSNNSDIVIAGPTVLVTMEFMNIELKYITELFKVAKLPFTIVE